MKCLLSRLRRFSRREEGTVIVEAVVVLPMLLWATFALFAFWDAYKSINTVQKASYTVSDMLSRRMDPVTMADLSGLRDVMNFLLDEDQTARMRVTSVTWSEANNRFEVLWSKSPDATLAELTTETLQSYIAHIPAMADGDTVVVVEAIVGFTPVFNVGLNDLNITEFIVTRPRLAPRVCFDVCA